jgi:hypothetical protein
MTKWFQNKHWRWGLLLISNFFLLQAGSASAVPEILVPPSPFKGLNGLRFDSTGQLYVGSVAEQTIYKVDVVATGKYEIFLKSPDGQADDLIFTPSGQIFYTALLSSEVRTFNPQTNKIATVAASILAVDPIAQDKSGRIFIGQSLSLKNTGLYEIDPTGENSPRLILNRSGLNAFDFGTDGLLYSPLQFTGEIIKINVDTGAIARLHRD